MIERMAAIRNVGDHLHYELEVMEWEYDTVVLDSKGRLRFWTEAGRRFAEARAEAA